MKKYSDEHLEGVEHEFIAAVELIIYKLSDGVDCSSWGTCPNVACGFGIICGDGHDENGEHGWCNKCFGYKGDCPCNHFGKEQAIIMAQNLVAQWKKWAGIDE